MNKFNRRDFLKLSGLSSFSLASPFISAMPASRIPGGGKKNVLVVVFDTLSAENIGLYGYPRDTMPNLSRIAEKATVYHNHFAGGPFTTPGTASLLTGTYPWTHRAFRIQGEVIDPYIEQNIFGLFDQYYRFAYSHNPVANTLLLQFTEIIEEYLKRQELYLMDYYLIGDLLSNDFDTAWFSRRQIYKNTANVSNSLFLPRILTMLDKGDKEKYELRQKYKKIFPRGLPRFGVDNYFLLEDGIDWIQKELPRFPDPFMAYFHFYPPHQPYNTRKEFFNVFNQDGIIPVKKPRSLFARHTNAEIEQARQHYDEFILYADAEFGRLYDNLESTGTLEDTWVIFTSDHGELLERGLKGHVYEPLYQGVIHIPLLILEPGQSRRRDVYENTSCIDIIPTLLKVTGQDIPDWLPGKVISPYSDTPPSADRSVFAVHARKNPKLSPLSEATVMMVKGDYKLTKYFGYEKLNTKKQGKPMYELYNLKEDPNELNNLFDRKQTLVKELLQELEHELAKSNEPYD